MAHDDEQDERSDQVRGALVKGLVALLAVAVVIALGTTLMVKVLGLDEGESSGPVGAGSGTSDPLPSTALPVPGEESGSPSPSDSPSEPEEPGGAIALSVSPQSVGPMQRINLTGTYRGADNARLEVQRQDNGAWSNFGVDAGVTAGTFQTYVQSGRTGENMFRLYDPAARKASNVVTVTIG